MPDSPTYSPTYRTHSSRLISLDVLRGMAILLMILAGLFPKTLPNFFDHGYNPHYLPNAAGEWTLRPEVTAGKSLFLSTWPAFTWVDLVFPLFLFAMGAALPMSLARRLQSVNGSKLATLRTIIGRWAILILFAGLVTHLTTSYLASSNADTSRLRVVGAFLIATLFFVRFPSNVPSAVVFGIRAVALLTLVIRIVGSGVRNDRPFSWTRTEYLSQQGPVWLAGSDIIILVLASTYLVAAILWLLTPRCVWRRWLLAVPIALAAHFVQYLNHIQETWTWLQPAVEGYRSLSSFANHALHVSSWMPGLHQAADHNTWIRYFFDFRGIWMFSWLKYLWLVVPGTIAGDWLYTWSQRRTIEETTFEPQAQHPSPWTLPLVLLVCAGAFVGLRHYGYGLWGIGGPLLTPFLALCLVLPPLALLLGIGLPRAYGHLWISRHLLRWGAGLTLAGLLLATIPISRDPAHPFFENGISKGPPSTLSYYLLSAGLCHLLLVALVERLDVHSRSRKPGVLESNGQNALLAYYLSHTVVPAVLSLSIFTIFTDSVSTQPTTASTAPVVDYTVRSLNDLMRNHLLPGTWPQALWALIVTLGLAVVVWIFTRWRIFWRA